MKNTNPHILLNTVFIGACALIFSLFVSYMDSNSFSALMETGMLLHIGFFMIVGIFLSKLEKSVIR